jgi:enoyl-CoA hydratase/carnithine racemase
VALRHTKASVRLAQTNHATQLDALSQVNTFYLDKVMQTVDAHEGLKAFLEKRPPEWKNA